MQAVRAEAALRSTRRQTEIAQLQGALRHLTQGRCGSSIGEKGRDGGAQSGYRNWLGEEL